MGWNSRQESGRGEQAGGAPVPGNRLGGGQSPTNPIAVPSGPRGCWRLVARFSRGSLCLAAGTPMPATPVVCLSICAQG